MILVTVKNDVGGVKNDVLTILILYLHKLYLPKPGFGLRFSKSREVFFFLTAGKLFSSVGFSLFFILVV